MSDTVNNTVEIGKFIGEELQDLQYRYEQGWIGYNTTKFALVVIAAPLAVAVRGEGGVRVVEKMASDVLTEWCTPTRPQPESVK